MTPADDASPMGLVTPEARAVLDRSGYGSWRAIATADAVSLAFGFPFPASFPTEQLRESVSAVLESEGPAALQYGGGEYARRLESYVLERAADRGIDSDDTAVLLTNGATHAIDSICRAFLEPGDVVAVERPTFMGSIRVFENFGVDVTGVPVDENGLDVAALGTQLAARRDADEPTPTLCYTIPNFQNPTGTTIPRARRERLIELAEEFDFVVIEDDAYGDLRYEGDPEPPMAALDETGRVIRVGSFAKTIAPGLRLGWILAAEPIRDVIDALTPGGTNTFTRSVVGHYCDAGHRERALQSLQVAYERRRDRMLDSLADRMPDGADWTTPDGGFFVWVDLPSGIDAAAMLDDAIEAGVTYLPGTMFYANEGGEDCLRLSYSYVSPDEIDEGIAVLAETVRERL